MNEDNHLIPADPFDEPLAPQESDRLILNDTYFESARGAITVDGMEYAFLKPPYMNFDDQIRAKQKLKEAYIANYDEKAAKISFMSSAIRLSERQMPEIYNRLPPICAAYK